MAPDARRADFLSTVESAAAPFIYNGLMMHAVAGREIARSSRSEQHKAHALCAATVLLGASAPPEREARWRAMVKGWLERDYVLPIGADAELELAALARLDQLLGDHTVAGSPEPAGHRHFHNTDRSAHRGSGWAASLAMASERISHYEFGNGENSRGYHTGSGWLSWWGDGHGQEHNSDAFWPTVDPYRIPGTTVSMLPLPDGWGGHFGKPRPQTRFVGGVTDGELGVAAQHLQGAGSTMRARKSWFFCDEAVVCLGSAIYSADGHAVVTTVDNRNLGENGTVTLEIDGREVRPDVEWESSAVPRWIHARGVGGYVFPSGGDVRLELTERSGAWRDINSDRGSDEVHTRRCLTTHIDHGVDPDPAAYAYVLVPGADRERTTRWAATGMVDILTHTDRAHAVRLPNDGAIAANFWAAGCAGELKATGRCSVLAREHADGTATVVVSDPARENRNLSIDWERPVAHVISAPGTVSSTTIGGNLRLTFRDLDDAAGAPQAITVELA
ncbi:polysaccharide lyase family 8 super-sandwich domain-containing protein [Phytoactinopolyspora endophytica]|uniref:polysaccharide lyase family 8 super-sandwich domain-containing protein n=1 Tax=Phytoactinopolyspora endophytica TaxID=1642495 RepID=UPI003B833B05